MSYKNLLNTLYPGRPVLDVNYAVLSAPVRHYFMMATVWYLTKNGKRDDLSILEIGSWYGASALSWAEGLTRYNDAKGHLTCVDIWEPFFDTDKHKDDVYVEMEKALGSDIAYNIFCHNIKTIAESIQAQHFRGSSDTVLPTLRDDHFDVVFIDADHTYEPVKKDIELSMRLVKDGGIICGDDLNLQLHECDAEFAKKHYDIDFTKDPKTGRNFHPGVTMAAAEIFGEVSMWGGFWAMQKQGDRWKPFSLSDAPLSSPNHFSDILVAKAEDHLKDIKVA